MFFRSFTYLYLFSVWFLIRTMFCCYFVRCRMVRHMEQLWQTIWWYYISWRFKIIIWSCSCNWYCWFYLHDIFSSWAEAIFTKWRSVSNCISSVEYLSNVSKYIFMIEWFNFSFRMMIVSRFYSIIRLYLDILTWKGVFGIFDNVVDPLSKEPW